MKSFQLRRLRGVMGLGVIWGVLWGTIFSALSTVVGFIRPEDIDPGEGPIDVWPIGGIIGLTSGIAFGILLAIAESGSAIRRISLSRAAIWGVLGSALFPLLTGRPSQLIILCPIGAALAVASVGIARKAAAGRSAQSAGMFDVIFGSVLTLVRDLVDRPKEAA